GILETGEKEKMYWKKVEAPDENEDEFDREVANHLSRLAQMLSNRTDDPNRGVGCVITIDKEIVATGWNGYPSKALYGNHPRLGKSVDNTRPDTSPNTRPDSKYPHVIHAEQNALMRRNKRNLDGATAFVNKIPCNECLPMLCDAGVKTLYLSKGAFKKKEKTEENFYKLLEKPGNPLIVYEQY
ncbi:deoxycytidylate deaminase-like, partial [Actinia tenebrosa]|uniref:dCMP deaminase n=1 Tax=Actinia tenebrosa TaxID=6105 RepID=A0A6P8I1N7_ACTTE